MEHMSDFLIKGAIIVFGFVPLGVAVAILTVCLAIGATKTSYEVELKAHTEEK